MKRKKYEDFVSSCCYVLFLTLKTNWINSRTMKLSLLTQQRSHWSSTQENTAQVNMQLHSLNPQFNINNTRQPTS